MQTLNTQSAQKQRIEEEKKKKMLVAVDHAIAERGRRRKIEGKIYRRNLRSLTSIYGICSTTHTNERRLKNPSDGLRTREEDLTEQALASLAARVTLASWWIAERSEHTHLHGIGGGICSSSVGELR